MDGTSLTPEQEKLNALKQVLPEVFAEGKVDWEKLKATLGEDINFSNERYVLNWAGKSDAFKVLQMPTTKTLIPAKGESVNFDETENIFIEGENLEVLKVLQKSYFGKVKVIYIDPPYNTGNDSFIYPDKFSESKADYERRVGDKDEDGNKTSDSFKKNSKENGQYHSNWLNMMMPRLYLAKNLLRQDGVIFVSIDDNEVHNLRLLMNEVFGEENFVESIIWKKRYGGGAKEKYLVSLHEYILVFAKHLDEIDPMFIPLTDESIKRYYTKKDEKYAERGGYRTHPLEATKSMGERKNLVYEIPSPGGQIISPKRQWLWGKERALKALGNNELEFIKDKDGGYTVHTKQYLKEENGDLRQGKAFSIIDNVYTQHGTNEIIDLFSNAQIFSFPKPTELLNQLIDVAIDRDNEIIMDLFCGSGSTAHSVLNLNSKDQKNRKYICVQLPELTDEKSEAYKAGYKTIAEISKERIRRAGKKIQEEINVEIKKIESEIKKLQGELPTDENKTEIENLKTKIQQLKTQDLGFKVLKLADSNFKQWQQIEGKDAKALAEQMKLFVDPVSESATIENMVYELLLKSGKDLNSSIEKKDSFYKINNSELILLLGRATQEIIDKVIAEKPIKVVALDKLFKGNDQLKTNTVLQMKDAEIEFKTI
jgi:adenine-specific DNA-methyltransferase